MCHIRIEWLQEGEQDHQTRTALRVEARRTPLWRSAPSPKQSEPEGGASYAGSLRETQNARSNVSPMQERPPIIRQENMDDAYGSEDTTNLVRTRQVRCFSGSDRQVARHTLSSNRRPNVCHSRRGRGGSGQAAERSGESFLSQMLRIAVWYTQLPVRSACSLYENMPACTGPTLVQA